MTFEKTVGVNQSYPDEPYPLAILEVMDRYLKPRLLGLLGTASNDDDLMINKGGNKFNPGFDFFTKYSQEHNIPFVLCLHAERQEVEQGKYNTQGQEILEYCSRNKIKVLSGLQIGEQLSDFRDQIHINEAGQKRWAVSLFNEIQKTIEICR
jgi:hypothetical protein